MYGHVAWCHLNSLLLIPQYKNNNYNSENMELKNVSKHKIKSRGAFAIKKEKHLIKNFFNARYIA
jgi:hypothetical protein